MVPPAPPRFSMTIGWPSCADTGSSTMRPTMSRLLPAENGTMARIGRAGHVCAATGRASMGVADAAATAWRKRRRETVMTWLSRRESPGMLARMAERRNARTVADCPTPRPRPASPPGSACSRPVSIDTHGSACEQVVALARHQMLKTSRHETVVAAPGMGAARRIGARIGECSATQTPLVGRERRAARLLVFAHEAPCLLGRRRLPPIVLRPVGAEAVCRNADEGRLVLAAQAVPVERHHRLLAGEADVLLAPVAVADDAAPGRNHAFARGARHRVDPFGAVHGGGKIEQLAVRHRPQ